MAHDQAPNKPVHLIFLFGGLLLFFLLHWTTDWVWGYFDRKPDEFLITVTSGLVALIAGIVFYRNETSFSLADEVAAELKKVTWPTAKEVKMATIVVIIMTVISALILGFFDFAWSSVTNLIYGGS